MDYKEFYLKNTVGKTPKPSAKRAQYSSYSYQYEDETDTQGDTSEEESCQRFVARGTKSEGSAARKGRGRGGLFVVLLIVLSFALTVALANHFSSRFITDELFAIFNPSVKARFFVVCFEGTVAESTAKSKPVRESGGAGNVFSHSGKTYVALAVYAERADAESVSKKNQGTTLVEILLRHTDDADTNRLLDCKAQALSTLARLASGVLAGTTSPLDAAAEVRGLRGGVLAEKEAVFSDKSLERQQKLALGAQYDTVLSLLENLTMPSDALVYSSYLNYTSVYIALSY